MTYERDRLTGKMGDDGKDADWGEGGVRTGRAARMGDGLTQKDFIAKGAFAIALPRIRGEI